MAIIRFSIAIIVAFYSFTTNAAKDPISWKLNQTFTNPVFVNIPSTIVYTFTNEIPITLVKPLVISKNASPAMEFSYNDQCTGKKLAPHESCTVQVTLIPLVNGEKFLQLTIEGYSFDQVPLPQLTTVAQGESASNIVGVTTQPLPATMTVGSSASYAFTFSNLGTTSATNLSATITQSLGTPNITSNNCTGTLTPGSSCEVRGTYIPSANTPNPQTVRATLTFSGASGSPVSTASSTTVTAAMGSIVGTLVPPNILPPLMQSGQTYTVQFLFSNVSGTTIPLGSNSVLCSASSGSCTVTNVFNHCTGVTQLLAGQNCDIEVTFTAPAATPPPHTTYTITATLNYTGTGSPAVVSSAGTVITTLPTNRTVTLVNDCDFPIWVSLNGAAVSGYTCPACPSGTTCNPGSGLCYWNNFAPGTYSLAASGFPGNGTQTTVTIPPPSFPSNGVLWSGNISASTLCNGTTCGQASCGNNGGSTSCAPGVGFIQPATQAEFTMLLDNEDTYDVEVINGFHLPISVEPLYLNEPFIVIPAVPNNYVCGTPGNFQAANGFGACAWGTATPPTPNGGYFWVTGGGASCNINAPSCTNPGQICGLDNALNQVCGNFLGYWSADEVCGKATAPAAVKAFFQCNQSLPSPFFPAGSTYKDLMLCQVPAGYTAPTFNSCYLPFPGYNTNLIQTCCGCADWWNPAQTGGVVIQSNPNTASCTQPGASSPQTDPQWNQHIQTKLQWMKQACPSAYTYPFDDKTSTFTCTNNAPGQPNSLGYIVTFCPTNSSGYNTGLPAGKTEGRG